MPGSVPCPRIPANRAAVDEVFQDRDAVGDDLVGAVAVDIDDKPHTAARVLVGGVVQPFPLHLYTRVICRGAHVVSLPSLVRQLCTLCINSQSVTDLACLQCIDAAHRRHHISLGEQKMAATVDQLKTWVLTHLKWFGQSAFRISTQTGGVVFIDPFRVPASAGPGRPHPRDASAPGPL